MYSLQGYDGFTEAMIFMCTWPFAAGLTVIAFILAFWPGRRRASLRFAVAGMVISAVAALPLGFLILVKSQDSHVRWDWLLVAFAPLVVALGVFWFNFRLLKRSLPVTHEA